MIIGRKKFDNLGNEIRTWMEEQDFMTDAIQDNEFLNLIISNLGITYDGSLE